MLITLWAKKDYGDERVEKIRVYEEKSVNSDLL